MTAASSPSMTALAHVASAWGKEPERITWPLYDVSLPLPPGCDDVTAKAALRCIVEMVVKIAMTTVDGRSLPSRPIGAAAGWQDTYDSTKRPQVLGRRSFVLYPNNKLEVTWLDREGQRCAHVCFDNALQWNKP